MTASFQKTPLLTVLWDYSVDFLIAQNKIGEQFLNLLNHLQRKPFKLKQGLIDFWIASFLFIKRDDFALFSESGYIPYLTDEVLELIIKYPESL